MAIAWDVNDVYDRKIILDAENYPKDFNFLNSTWRNEEEVAF